LNKPEVCWCAIRVFYFDIKVKDLILTRFAKKGSKNIANLVVGEWGIFAQEFGNKA